MFPKAAFFTIRYFLFSLLCLMGIRGYSQQIRSFEGTELIGVSRDSATVDSLLRFSWNNKYNSDSLALYNADFALHISQEINYTAGIINAYNYLGLQYEDWANYPKALDCYQKGLQIAEKINNHADKILFFLLFAQTFDDEHQYPDALLWNRKAFQYASDFKDSLNMARAVGNIAIIMDKTGHLDSAYHFNLQSLNYFSHGVGNTSDSAGTYNNLALNQKRQKKFNNALYYLTKARNLINVKDTFSIQIWYDNMGSLYNAMHQFENAKAMFDTALSLREVVHSRYIDADLYNNISQYYESRKDFSNALSWYKKSVLLYDTIRNNQQKQQFEALQIQYNVGQKELQIAKQQGIIKEQHKLTLTAFLGLLLLVILTFMLLNINRKKRKANALLSERNDQITLQRERLEQVNQVKDKLFSIISHDLKSPMESLRFYLSMLSNHKLSAEELQENAVELQHHFQHTKILIDNLLYWASTQIKGWQLHLQQVNLYSLSQEVIGIVSSDASRKKITISNQVPENLSAYTDPNLLKLALRNVLSNAVKFTPDKGAIIVEGKNMNDKVRLSVYDNGIGISKEKLEQFKNGIPLPNQPGTKQEKGTGLGILVSRQFLEKQGGSMEIVSQKGEGTTVNMELPMKENVNLQTV